MTLLTAFKPSSTAASCRQQSAFMLVGFLLGWSSCALFFVHHAPWKYHQEEVFSGHLSTFQAKEKGGERLPQSTTRRSDPSAASLERRRRRQQQRNSYGDFCNSTIVGERQLWNVGHKKVISFSVFRPVNGSRYDGKKGRTLKWVKAGIFIQAETALQYYPDWIVRFHVDNLLSPQEEASLIQNYSNVELVHCQRLPTESRMMMSRFLVVDDPTVAVSIIRDVDSRFGVREVMAVHEWLASNNSFHIMRDHKSHIAPIMGGTLGMRRNCLNKNRTMVALMEQAFRQHAKIVASVPGEDQSFLALYVWPLVKNQSLAHDSRTNQTDHCSQTTCRDFPLGPRHPMHNFVGRQYKSDKLAMTPNLCF